MLIKKIMVCTSLVVMSSALTLSAQAADKPDTVKAEVKTPAVPIVIEADSLMFNEESGELTAKGKVKMVKNGEVIFTDYLRGNNKKQEVWIDGPAEFVKDKTKLTGIATHYNYETHTGTMQQAYGQIGRQRITGQGIDIQPKEMIVNGGTITACPAKVPDYHISAERLEIWPGEKMVVYNAKFWIKDKQLFTLPRYQLMLDRETQSHFPRIGYNTSDGMYIKQYMEFPTTNNFAIITDLDYYGKLGFKPTLGVINREKDYSLKVVKGDYRDGNSNWISKEPEFKFDYYTKKLGNGPLNYHFTALAGNWRGDNKSSWHQDYNLYFSREPIVLGQGLALKMGIGGEIVRESYDHSTQKILNFDAELKKQWSERLTTTFEYHYTSQHDPLFKFDVPEVAREGAVGVIYKVDRLNSIGVRESYDLHLGRTHDIDYTWYRNLHCWQASLTYRSKRQQLNWEVSTLRW